MPDISVLTYGPPLVPRLLPAPCLILTLTLNLGFRHHFCFLDPSTWIVIWTSFWLSDHPALTLDHSQESQNPLAPLPGFLPSRTTIICGLLHSRLSAYRRSVTPACFRKTSISASDSHQCSVPHCSESKKNSCQNNLAKNKDGFRTDSVAVWGRERHY
ncbi:hypothetical protein GOODEAATRI_023539 [Goodea atripinnis]|uniref:Uncharacterized protein n=1 Tax=Goodea atripinnis TaxID=208336 RepID=A0ABV0MK63_9TELE